MKYSSALPLFTINAVAQAAAFLLFASAVFAQSPVTDKSSGTAAPVATVAPAAPNTPPTPQKMFVSIGDKPAVLFDAPSNRANKLFIILRNTPLEVLVKLDKMTKVRDADGSTIGWVENETLGSRRHVQVATTLADVRASADAGTALAFEAQRAVLLEVTGAVTAGGWLPVKHRDGQAGFIRLTQVWGG